MERSVYGSGASFMDPWSPFWTQFSFRSFSSRSSAHFISQAIPFAPQGHSPSPKQTPSSFPLLVQGFREFLIKLPEFGTTLLSSTHDACNRGTLKDQVRGPPTLTFPSRHDRVSAEPSNCKIICLLVRAFFPFAAGSLSFLVPTVQPLLQ